MSLRSALREVRLRFVRRSVDQLKIESTSLENLCALTLEQFEMLRKAFPVNADEVKVEGAARESKVPTLAHYTLFEPWIKKPLSKARRVERR